MSLCKLVRINDGTSNDVVHTQLIFPEITMQTHMCFCCYAPFLVLGERQDEQRNIRNLVLQTQLPRTRFSVFYVICSCEQSFLPTNYMVFDWDPRVNRRNLRSASGRRSPPRRYMPGQCG